MLVCMIHEIANQAFHLSKGLAQAGHKVKVILDESVRSEAYLFSHSKIPEVEVYRVQGGPTKFRGLFSALPLLREIIKFKPDIIHVHYLRTLVLIATFAALLLRIPIIGVAHGSDIRGRTRVVRRAIMRLFMHRINRVIITAAHFANEAYMVPQEKMEHIPRLVDTDMFRSGIDYSNPSHKTVWKKV